MIHEGVGGGFRDEPELLQFATERFVEAEASVEDLETDGLTDLQLCAQYCRDCTVSVQRLFHVRSLGRVCADALRVGAEPFPLDLLEDLAQDDDSEVRQSVAEQLVVLTDAVKKSRKSQDDDVALGLLNVAFLLVEDDSDGVVAAAEDATATVATICTTGDERASLMSRVETLCKCEEEEIRVSGSKIAGTLAEVLGAETTASTLAPLLKELSRDEALQVREATVRATVRAGESMRGTDAALRAFDIFRTLASDPVWSVRKACADSLVGLSKSVGRDAFAAFAQEVFETLANDVSLQVRTGMLENLGPLIAELGRERTSESLVDHFVSMAESTGGSASGLQLSCAFAIPGVALTLGRDRWGEIRGAYDLLTHSVHWKVRRSLACSLHEMAKILGSELAEADLVPVFEEMLGDTDEVSIGVVNHLAAFMREIPPAARLDHLHVLARIATPKSDVTIGNWRLRAAMTEQLGDLSKILPASANEEVTIPLTLRLLKDPASAVREACIAVVGSVLQNSSDGSSSAWRFGQIGRAMSAIKLMATNQHWADRQAYVRICGAFVGVINDNVLVEELLPLMLMTVDDNVPNVRSELAKSLAKLRRRGIFAELPDVSAAVDALRNDPDQDVSRHCVIAERSNHFEFSTGLRATPLRLKN